MCNNKVQKLIVQVNPLLTCVDKPFDWLLCNWIPVHASEVVFVAPAISICNEDLGNFLQLYAYSER